MTRKFLRSALRTIISFKLAGATPFQRTSRWFQTAVAALVWLLATIPVIAQTNPATSEKSQLASVHGTLTTSQADTSGGWQESRCS
jgi:hypothetical protein